MYEIGKRVERKMFSLVRVPHKIFAIARSTKQGKK